MNRLEMARRITERVPVLMQRDAAEWKHLEKLRQQFVTDYAVSRIPQLTIDEERRNHPTRRYQHTEMWGDTPKEAFASVREAIVDLLRAAQKDQMAILRTSKISPMFKGKILFLYFPQKYAPIYSPKHLKHFAAELNLEGPFKDAVDIQRALMTYRASWPELAGESECLYMRFLYDVFGYPPEEKGAEKPAAELPLLDDAVAGADFIDEMPALVGGETNRGGMTGGKPDYRKRLKRLERIGDRGEAIVVALEKKRLRQTGKTGLAKRVDRVSEGNDRLGYDILSFEEDGSDRFIEVKATSGKNLDRGFYITDNEVKQAAELENYYLYLVFSALTKKPRILPVKHPGFKGKDFVLDPVVYHATLPKNGLKSSRNG